MGAQVMLLAGLCLSVIAFTLAQSPLGPIPDVCSAFNTCGEGGTTCTCTKGCPGGENITGVVFCSGLDQCSTEEACVGGRCVDPCVGRCGANTKCKVINHAPLCSCLPDHSGNPITGCELDKPTICDANAICTADRACVGQICIDPCTIVTCPEGTVCQTANHTVSCIQKPIEEPECTQHFHCQDEKSCVHQRCIDPCSFDICGPNAECLVTNHKATCTLIPPVPKCKVNKDCSSENKCYKGKCVDPCQSYVCPGKNAECKVISHVLVCITTPIPGECESDEYCASDKTCVNEKCVDPCSNNICPGECRVLDHKAVCIQPPPDECTGHESCPVDRQCIGKKCIDPCGTGICNKDAICVVKDHEVSCITTEPDKICTTDSECDTNRRCTGGKCFDPCTVIKCFGDTICITADHKTTCTPKPPKEECTAHTQCPTDKVCSSNKCIDPCLSNVCGNNSLCQVEDHKISCIGQPEIKPECEKNGDCEENRNCADSKCVNPCETNICGDSFNCKVINHTPVCIPDPDDKGQCSVNTDCDSEKQCLDKKCIDPCSAKACPSGNTCTVEEHKVICMWKPKVPDECKSNDECTEKQACLGGKCVDPCEKVDCNGARCLVKKHVAFCIGEPPKEGVCDDDSGCPDGSICKDKFCVNPCANIKCGQNALCQITNGAAFCSCSPGFSGDPEKGCEEDDGGDKGGDNNGGYGLGNCSSNSFPQEPPTKQYYPVTNYKTTWWQAFQYCIAHGRRLAVIENKEENELILEAIKKTNIRNDRFWVSGTQWGQIYRWKWMTTGLPVTNFTYWRSGPGGYYCMNYYEYSNIGYMWNDWDCYWEHHFICQDHD